MKTRKFNICLMILLSFSSLISCDDFLDREPLSTVSPEIYFTDASQLESYANSLYTSILPSHETWGYGIFSKDADTDNQVGREANDRYADGRWRVPNTEDTDWNFELIYRCNYFLSNVLPKFGADVNGSMNTITGDLGSIQHYIGEVYFLRACEYFKRYQLFGDFPIVTEPLQDDMDQLIKASCRMPRTEVARFILDDLDKAYEFLCSKEMATTRINKDVALLLKSRVALFEGTWLKYFKGTAFVPNGEGWPGKMKDYNAGYEFKSGNIDKEIDWFLEKSMNAAEIVAETYKNDLTVNTGYLQQSLSEPNNPYYDMFAQENLSEVKEVLLWRQYGRDLSMHNVNVSAGLGNYGIGITRGLVNNFLMRDGKPVYAHGSYTDGDGYYMGDKTIANVKTNRDSRLQLFLKEPGQKNILIENVEGTSAKLVEPYPDITNSAQDYVYTTGYALRKGGSFDQKHYANNKGYTAAVCYRATEALLNYMEASYEKNGSLDIKAREYWEKLRQRAGITGSIEETVAATDMVKEAQNDWGAYSCGQLLSDPILYNIRRERRCEMIAEGLRYMDLCRWRAMDQLTTTPYHVEGIHIWNTPMTGWYDNLKSDGTADANVSSLSLSEYLRPYQKNNKQTCYEGCTWHLAHYLTPIMVKQFLVTSADGSNVETSPLYQNPYWPVVADQPAER